MILETGAVLDRNARISEWVTPLAACTYDQLHWKNGVYILVWTILEWHFKQPKSDFNHNRI